MKKLIVILLLACGTAQAQQTCRDSALVQIQMDFKHMRTNINEARAWHQTGLAMHCVGAWYQVIAITGYEQDYFDKTTYNKAAVYGLGFNLLGVCMEYYSHKFVKRAALQMTPGGVKYTF